MVKKTLILVLLLLITGCSSIRYKHPMSPDDVEWWILRNTGYNHPLLSCQQRARIAKDYLTHYGYKAEIRESAKYTKDKIKFHAYVKYIDRDGKEKSILNLEGFKDVGPQYSE